MHSSRFVRRFPCSRGPPSSWSPAVLTAIGVLIILGLGGCGGGDSSSAGEVARVGEASITRAEYDKSFDASASSYAQTRGFRGQDYYDPPRFRLCVRDRAAGGGSADAMRVECHASYVSLRRDVLTTLIETEWIEQGARERGIHLSLAAAKRRLRLPDPSTEAPIRRLGLLSERIIRREANVRRERPSATRIAAYYHEHEDYFKQPETRDVVGFATPTRATALAAAGALSAGRSWPAVARRYAIARAPDRFAAVRSTELDPSLVPRAFSAREGVVVGPVRTGETWYLLTVPRIYPAFRMSLEQATKPIREWMVLAVHREARLHAWRRFRERARAETHCLTPLKVPACANGPRAGFQPSGALDDPLPEEPILPPVRELVRGG